MTIYRIIALAAAISFYAIYLQRQFALGRRGIRADRLGKGQKERSTRTTEIVLLAITLSMPVVQMVSIFLPLWQCTATPTWLSGAGAVVAFAGVGFFLLAVVAMRENWRAGIDREQKTDLVTRGVYRISRNPAFVGFDLFYIGIASMFPNPVLVALTVAGIIVFHLQIIQEERYMRSVFGTSYADYARRTRRYL